MEILSFYHSFTPTLFLLLLIVFCYHTLSYGTMPKRKSRGSSSSKKDNTDPIRKLSIAMMVVMCEAFG